MMHTKLVNGAPGQKQNVTPAAGALDLSVYAGTWVAIVRGRVVACGPRAHDTLLRCRAVRLKDEPILRYVPSAQATGIKRK